MNKPSAKSTTNYLKIGAAAKALGVSIDTLRRWEKSGKITAIRTPGGTRLYSLSQLKKVNPASVEDFQAKSLTTEELLRLQGDALEAQPFMGKEIATGRTGWYIPRNDDFKRSFVNKFLISTAVLSVVTLAITSWIAASYLTQPKETAQFFKNNVASGLLSPFHKLAEETVAVISPKKARELGFVPEQPPPIPYQDVLAVTSAPQFLEVNSDTQINGILSVRDSINGLSLEATPSAGTIALVSGNTSVTVTNSATLDQDVSTASSPTFAALNLSGTKDQLVFQSGGPTGTITWTPTGSAKIITLPDATTTLVGIDTTNTLKNKTISGSDNTLKSIPNSALSNAKITVSAGTNLTGGGDVNLGSSVTLSVKGSPSFTGQVQLEDGTAAAPSLTFASDADIGLYRIGSNSIGLITAGSATSGITIDSSGNVGVGNITPSSTLYVSGNVGIGFTGSSVAVPNLGLAVFGNVGIGTSNAGSFGFQVNTTIGPELDATYDLGSSGIRFRNLYLSGTTTSGGVFLAPDGSASAPGFSFTSDTDTGIFRPGTNALGFSTGGSSRLTITAAGNVGIGVTNPVGALQVNGAAAVGFGSIPTSTLPSSGLAVSGNVGIGTTSPLAPLHNIGNALFSGNVGIGFTSPSAALYLRSTANQLYIDSPSSTGESSIRFLQNGSQGVQTGIGNYCAGANPCWFVYKSLTDFRQVIDDNGNVGIGTTIPTALLHVYNTGSSASFRVDDATADTTPFLIDASGNVGIGITVPDQLFTIANAADKSALNIRPGTTNDGLYLTSDGVAQALITGGGEFTGTTVTNALAWTARSTTSSAVWNIAGTIQFFTDTGLTAGSTFTPTERMRIDGSGNVGIGFTSSTALTHLVQTAAADAFRVDDVANDITPFIVNLDGNVGIANSAPSYTLDVIGTTRFSTSITQAGGQFLAADGTAALPAYSFSADTNSGLWRIGADQIALTTAGGAMSGLAINSSGNVGIGNTSASQIFQVNPSGTSAFVVTSGGNVGIGFTTPDRSLQVALDANPAGTNASLINTAATTQLSLTGSTAGGLSKKLVLGIDTTDNFGVIQAGSTDGTNYTLALNPAGGNVGIGTTTPQNLLDVRGTIGVSTSDTQTVATLLSVSGDGFLRLYTGEATPILRTQISSNGASFFNLGNVGIGNSAPGAGLSISTNAVIGYGNGINGPSTGLAVSGNVGIGTTTANSALAVAGGAVIGAGFNATAPTNGLLVQGNVGIGFTSPDRTLQIASDLSPAVNIGALLGAGGSQLSITGSTSDTLNTKLAFGVDTTFNYAFIQSGQTLGVGNTPPISLSINPAGGNVGIGTSAPANKLVVDTTTNGGGLTVQVSSTGTPAIKMLSGSINTSARNWGFFTNNVAIGDFEIRESATNGLSSDPIAGTGAVRLFIASGGNVGIGTSAAGARLQVNGGGIFWPTTASLTGPTNGLAVSGNVGIGITTANSNLSVAGNAHIGGLYQGIAAPANGLFVDGNVGIGATTSSNLLDVWGNARITGNLTTDGTLSVNGSSTLSSLTLTGANAALSFTGTTPSITAGSSVFGLFAGGNVGIGTTGNLYGGLTVRGAGTGTNITLQTYGSNLTQGLTVLDNGNVGIGTTNPTAILQLSRTTTASPGVLIAPGFNGTGSSIGTQFTFSNSGSSLTSAGTVYISAMTGGGGPTDSYNLFIEEPPSVGSTTRSSLVIGGVPTAGGAYSFVNNSTQKSYFVGNVGIGTTNVGGSLVVMGGNVGIGFTTPDRLTQIASDINIVGSNASLLGSAGTQFSLTGSTAAGLAKKLVLGIDTTDNYGVIQAGNTDGTNYTLALNPAGGSVGIGITSPLGTLAVAGRIALIRSSDTSALAIDIYNTSRQTIGTFFTAGAVDQFITGAIAGDTGLRAMGGNLLFGTTSSVNVAPSSIAMIINTGGNVGIGTISPGKLLHVQSTTADNHIYVSSVAPSVRLGNNATLGSRTNELVLGLATADNNYITGTVAGDGVLYVASPNAGTARSLIFGTGALQTERMRIDSSGNVGIGPSTPGGSLVVSTGNVGLGFTTPDRGLQLADDLNIVGSNASLMGADGTQFAITGSSGTGTSKKLVLGIDTTDNYGVIQSGNTDGTNYTLSLNPAGGNVGIGTTVPTTLFEMSSASDAFLTIRSSTEAVNTTAQVRFLTGLSANADSNQIASIIATITQADPSTLQGALSFRTNTGDSAVEAMRITAGSNVGIGTASPSQIFQVNASGTSAFVVTSAGNVGIGWTSPGALIHAVSGANGPNIVVDALGTFNLTGATNVDGILQIASNSNQAVDTGGSISFAGRNTTSSAINTIWGAIRGYKENNTSANGNAYMAFVNRVDGTGVVERMRINSAGNLGIGFTSPTALTHIVQTAAADAFRVDDVANDTTPFVIASDGNVGIQTASPSFPFDMTPTVSGYLARIYNVSTTAAASGLQIRIDQNTASNVALALNGGSSGRILYAMGSGNIGIGTSQPGSTLQVQGNAVFGFGTGNSADSIAGPSSGLAVSGNVGIGTTSTSQALHVVGSGQFTTSILNADGSASAPAYSFSADTDTGLWRVGANLLALTSGGTPAAGRTINGLSVESSGSVGIGTTNFSTGAILQVQGYTSGSATRIIAAEVLAATNTGTQTGDVIGLRTAAGVRAGGTQNGGNFYGLYIDGAFLGGNYGATVPDIYGQRIINQSTGTGAGTSYALRIDNQAGAGREFGLYIDGADNAAIAVVSGNVGIGTTAPAGALIVTSGNVGIGTSAANNLLNVASTNADTNFNIARFSSAPDVQGEYNYISVGDRQTGDFAKFGFLFSGSTANTGAFIAGGSDKTPNQGLFVQFGGNVGIGFTSPTELLQVFGSGQVEAEITSTTGGAALRLNSNAASAGFINVRSSIEGGCGAGCLSFSVDNGTSENLAINANGLVGIAPVNVAPGMAEELDVEGQIQLDLDGTTDTTIGVCKDVADASGVEQDVEFTDCSTTPGDIAEWYATETDVEEGDLVALTGNTFEYEAEGSDPLTGFIKKLGLQRVSILKKALTTDRLLGIVSTGPYQVFGEDVKNAIEASGSANIKPMPVALAGRVPVRVSTENGPIEIGDYITSSSTPGVGMKALRPGQVVGKALEAFPADTSGVGFDSPEVKFGKILTFVNVSYADPGNFLASLSLDSDGNLIIPKIRTASIILDQSVASASAQLTTDGSQLAMAEDPAYFSTAPPPVQSSQFYDLSGKIASIEDRIAELEKDLAGLNAADLRGQAQIKNLQDILGNVGIATSSATLTENTSTEASPSSVIASDSEAISNQIATSSASQTPRNDVSNLNLTPPDILLQDSAILANLTVTSEATMSGVLTAYQAEIKDHFKVLGQTTLSDTLVAGDLTVNGTLSIERGSEINVIGISQGQTLSTQGLTLTSGILYLQRSPLAQGVDIFNGKVTIDKDGVFKAVTLVADQIKINEGQSAGSGKILAGQTEVLVENPYVEESSIILVTPNTPLVQTLGVVERKAKAGDAQASFKVQLTHPEPVDINFDYLIIGMNKPPPAPISQSPPGGG